MLNRSLRFLAILFIILLVSYVTHTFLVTWFSLSGDPVLRNLSYLFNGLYAVVLILVIHVFYKKWKDHIGFLVLGGSLVKIGVFLAIIKFSNYEINKSVFLEFFIPYVISLILEVHYISKILNNLK
ncbi:hypothetical protein GCM10022393_06750 [Aquimarina addita]|uniref:DUF4345 domain-containing protein n=1 Tax=Aquimarina addita TaxID=870485 RepID=A0ABP7XB03_9FLAO